MTTWCDTCQNTGSVDCYCGGDLCVCENHGEMLCPSCGGQPLPDDDDDGWYEIPRDG